MTAATARQTSPRKGWVNHVPSHRLRQPRAMDPKSKPLDAQERAYIEFADDLRKDRPYFTERPDVLAALMGFGRGPAAIRKLQRLEARMEANKQIRRVLIPGRPDLVSGRDTFTGRIGVIPLVTRTELPIVADWGPSPIRAKTYGKEPLQPSIWANYIDKKGGVGGTPRDIAQNYGVQLAVGAMFANELAYCAQ